MTSRHRLLLVLLATSTTAFACSGSLDDPGIDQGETGNADDSALGADGNDQDATPGSDTNVGGDTNVGSDTTPPPGDTSPPPTDTTPPTVPGAVYGAKCTGMSANELKAWTDVAIVRGKAKMGAIDCIDAIQTAARNHSHYMEVNGLLTHTEDASKPGYTGVNFWDRMSAAGFGGPGSAMFEVAHSINDGDGSILGEGGWINTLYHRIPFVSFGAGGYGFGAGASAYSTMDFASGGSTPSPSTISTWPVDGDTEIWTTFRAASEIPNPLPGKTNAGYPVSITGGAALSVSTHTLTDPSGTAIDHALITKATDSSGLVPDSQAYLIASNPLNPTTKYTAHFAGTSGGAAFDVTFSFTTASH